MKLAVYPRTGNFCTFENHLPLLPTRMNNAAEIDRYVTNAKQILSEKAKKHGTEYQVMKYVQMASGTAYNAVLMVADEFLKQKEGDKFVKPKSIEDYKKRVAKYDKKFLKYLNGAYEQLHLLGYYHGTLRVKAIQEGFDYLEKMRRLL